RNGWVGLGGLPGIGDVVWERFDSWGFEPDMIGLANDEFMCLTNFCVLLIVTIGIIWFFVRQNHSRIGRAFAAIRMDEEAAKSMGINITYYKVLSFAQSAIVAGFAGALYAHVLSFIIPGAFSYH